MMSDNDALNRRSKLPTRIAPDRPQGHDSQILWETIQAQDKTKENLQEQQIARTIKEMRKKENDKQHIMTFAQKKRRRIQNKDTPIKRNIQEKRTEPETDIDVDRPKAP